MADRNAPLLKMVAGQDYEEIGAAEQDFEKTDDPEPDKRH